MSRLNYFLSSGIKGFFRHGIMSAATIAILVSAMLICGSFLLVIDNIDYNIAQIDDFDEIVVYASLSATDEQVAAMQAQIEALPNVTSCTFVSKEDSIKTESDRYGEKYEHLFNRYINNPSENPLPDMFRIEYEDINKLDILENDLRTKVDNVLEVKVRKDIADNINQVKTVIMLVCIVLTALLLVVSLFIIANTIKIALMTREKEITIMRYIGATKAFITLPLVVESMISAFFSTVISFFIQVYAYNYITERIIRQYGIVETIPVENVWVYILVGFAAISYLLCIFGTIFSARRYLKA